MYNSCSCPYCVSQTMQHGSNMYNDYGLMSPYPYFTTPYHPQFSGQFATQDMNYESRFNFSQFKNDDGSIVLKDYGPKPFVVNIEKATKQNNSYRTALWTGNNLQLTLMSIDVGDDIGLEVHPHLDQFLRIEEGQGIMKMGNSKNNLYYQRRVKDGFAIFVPAGTWHDLINTGNKPIKLYSIYAPPNHPRGTIQQTKAIAQAEEKD